LTPFARLALFYGSALAAGAIAGVWIFVSAWIALAAIVGGAAIAIVSTLEGQPAIEPETASDDVAKPEARDGAPTFGLRIRPVREIQRDAERAREET
jgi:hypothetical protein